MESYKDPNGLGQESKNFPGTIMSRVGNLLAGKVATDDMATAQNPHGGQEATIQALYTPCTTGVPSLHPLVIPIR